MLLLLLLAFCGTNCCQCGCCWWSRCQVPKTTRSSHRSMKHKVDTTRESFYEPIAFCLVALRSNFLSSTFILICNLDLMIYKFMNFIGNTMARCDFSAEAGCAQAQYHKKCTALHLKVLHCVSSTTTQKAVRQLTKSM